MRPPVGDEATPGDDVEHPAPSEDDVERLLELARQHLDMDVAFLGRFDGNRRHLEAVATADPERSRALVGTSDPEDATYCRLIADNRLAAITPDAAAEPLVAGLDVTEDYDIGAYVGVPVVVDDGTVWGTVCAFSHEPDPDLDDEASGALRFVAGVIADRIRTMSETEHARHRAAARIDNLLVEGGPRMVGHGIVDLGTGDVVGIEALARFDDGEPDEIFRLAALGRRSTELELAAVVAAVSAIERLSAPRWLSCNVNLTTATDPRFLTALEGIDARRLVVEITEHETLDDEEAVTAVLQALRLRGAGIALDDVGAAWSGLQRALRLEPEFLKLDRGLITDVQLDTRKQALVGAVVTFADRVGATLVAEGIETADEAAVLLELGVPLGQGYLFGRPVPLPDAALVP